MKNKLIIILFLIFFNAKALAENMLIEAKKISLDKDRVTSVFEGEVVIKTKEKIINSEYVKYNKETGFLIIKDNVRAKDNENNIIETQYAEYFEKEKIFISKGPTVITTTEKYILEGEDITFDNNKRFIKSNKKSILKDLEGNIIYLENFEYQIVDNIFKSIDLVKVQDKMENIYEFSQIYIDTKKKEILGTDTKAFLNHDDFKTNKDNKPRIFSNTVRLKKEQSTFNKSIFTLCNYRSEDKCPPWSIQATEMLHDNKKKTIYYDNAVIKVYDIPIFYIPRLSHPDPTVDRRSGFMPPAFSNAKNLGTGISIPYFFAINNDKNFTLTNKIYNSENPLFLGEYHQAFKQSNFFADFGFTEGYKKSSSTKKTGEKSHFFSKFVKNFNGKNNSKSTLSLSAQEVSNDKYLKLYKIKSNLADYNLDTLESSLNYTLEDEDFFFGLNASVYETIKEDYNDKYEYILPEVTFDKNLITNDIIGSLDLQTNLKVHNYDTNKFTNFLVNDFNWNSKEKNYKSGLEGKFLGQLKNINYEAKNVDLYKEKPTNELFGAIGYLSKLNLQKKLGGTNQLLTPKILVRYAPGSMRKDLEGDILNPLKAFSLDRLNNINNFETGLSSTLGFDYKLNKNNQELDFSVAQIVSEKENKKMPTKTGLDEKLSDLVGSANFKINENVNLNYQFALDQNYKDLNYNEIGSSFNLNPVKIDFSYLEENKHIGNQEYFKTKFSYEKNNGLLSYETKRNLITNSSEFYNLSYEYINDCLRAGLVYRREFYTDSEIEPENSLMFKITLTPFGDINTPSFN